MRLDLTQNPTSEKQTDNAPVIEDGNTPEVTDNDGNDESQGAVTPADPTQSQSDGTDGTDNDGASDDNADDAILDGVTIDDATLTGLISDENVYGLWKGLAQAGGLVIHGIKDAEHLEAIVLLKSASLRLLGEFAAVKQGLNNLELADSIEEAAADNMSEESRKGLSGEFRFGWDKTGKFYFNPALAHVDLPDESTYLTKRGRKNGNGNHGNGDRKSGVNRSKGVWGPLAKSHGNANKYAHFVLLSIGDDDRNDDTGKGKLYNPDNLAVLISKTEAVRKEIGFKEAPEATGEDTKDKQMWVATLNVALAKHHGHEIGTWL